jgi:uncharacterized protein (TIGR03435 family)
MPNDKDKYLAALHSMTQHMLADRFKPTVHRDQKTFSVYALTVVRIPLKAITDSGGKAITIPEANRSGVGAKRRWHFDVAKTESSSGICPERLQRQNLA